MALHVAIGCLFLVPSLYVLAWGTYMAATGRPPTGRAARDWRNRPVPRWGTLGRSALRLNGVGLIAGGVFLLAGALRVFSSA